MIVGRQTALFLDYDGTLVDLAPTPEAARPTGDLVPLLQCLDGMLGGALAVLSGRTVADIDRMLAPMQVTAAGVHGAEVRLAGSRVERPEVSADLDAVRRLCRTLRQGEPRLRVEDKGPAIAIHYRAVPEAQAPVHEALRAALSDAPDLELINGKMVFEVRRPGMHKGAVLHRLMQRPPFLGRVPLMIGDDRTDEDAFAMALELGGGAIKVGDGETIAPSRLADPQSVRDTLRKAAATMKDAR